MILVFSCLHLGSLHPRILSFALCAQCGKKLRKITPTEKKSSNQLFSNCSKTVDLTKFSPNLSVSKFPQFSHCGVHTVENRKIHCHANFFPSNHSIVKFFSKMLIWRNFCEKTLAVKFCDFHSVVCRRCASILHCEKKRFVKSNFMKSKSWFDAKFVEKRVENTVSSCRNFTAIIYSQNFREINVLTPNWFDGKNFAW